MINLFGRMSTVAVLLLCATAGFAQDVRVPPPLSQPAPLHLYDSTTGNSKWELLMEEGRSQYKSGRYEAAFVTARQAQQVAEETHDPDSLALAESLKGVAILYQELRKYPEAETLFVRVLAIHEKKLGQESPDLAYSLNNLAAIYQFQGQYEKAEPLHLRALLIREKANDRDVVQSLNYLGALYQSLGNYDKAESHFKRMISALESVVGTDHPFVPLALNNLSVVYRDEGKYGEAEAILHRAIDIWERNVGPDPVDIIPYLQNLTELYRRAGRLKDAESTEERAQRIRALNR